MASRSATRTQPCSIAQARTRLEHARKFLEVAELVAGEAGDLEYVSAAAALAVLGGITASDAACCAALSRLLSLKDEAHYGLFDVSGQDLQAALRQTKALLEFAGEVIQRRPA